MSSRGWWLGVVCVLALALSACGDDGSGGKTHGDAGLADAGIDADDDAGGDVASAACTPDPELVAQQQACTRDEQCPCGTHCWLGQCQASCEADGDCGDGQYCDDFGTCRDGQDTAKVALSKRSDQGRLQPQRPLATVSDARPVTSILVRAADGPIAQARVVAGDGYLVAVTDGSEPAEADFSKQVMVDEPLERDDTVTLWTERDPADTSTEPVTNQVTIFDSGGHSSSVTITNDTTVLDGEPSQPTLAGVYTGVARLSARGSTGGVGDNMSATGRLESVPLSAKIFDMGAEMRLVITDELHVLHPQGQWVGTLGADAQTLTLPAFEALALDQIALANSQVVAVPADVRLQGDPAAADWNGVLQIGLDLQYQGIADADAVPTARWQITLARTGDIASGDAAPELQQDAELAYDTAQEADTEFNAEQAFASITADYQYAHDRWEATRQAADLTLTGGDLQVCAKPIDPRASSNDTYSYYDSYYESVFADVLAASLPSNAYYLYQIEDTAPKTVAQMAASSEPLIADLYGGITPSNITLSSGRITLASVFRDRYNQAQFAPPITLADGTTIDYALPCDVDFRDAPDTVEFDWDYSAPEPQTYTLDVPNKVYDYCQSAAQRLDCEIVDVSSQLTAEQRLWFLNPRNTFPFIESGWEFQINNGTDFTHRMTAYVHDVHFNKVCIPPLIPARCAEGLACQGSAAGGSGPVDLDGLNADSQAAASGDFACGDTGRAFGYGMDTAGIAADALLEDCVADTQAMETPRGTASGANVGEQLTSIGWYDDHGCFNPVQLAAGVGRSTEMVRFWRDRNGAKPTVADALAIRLLQKWTDAHALIASEATHATTFGHLNSQQSTIDQMETRLHQSLRGWRFLLQPRVATALLSLSPEALRNPDYRQRLAAGAFTDEPYNRQGAGLVVSMAELLDAQMKLGDAIAEMHALQGTRSEPASLAELMQIHQVAGSLIEALVARSRDYDGSYGAWEPRLRSAQRRVGGGWVALANRIDAMIRGRNPLGIEDVDLPLYFRELHDDAVSRFGAVSDFLLGQSNDSQAWAASLVRSASDAYDGAKQAYLDEQSRQLNEQANESAKAVRVDNTKTDFGLQMIDMCGSAAFGGASADQVYDATDWATFDAATCWYRAERSECRPDAGRVTDLSRRKGAIEYSLCTSSRSAAQPGGVGRRTVYATVAHQGVDFRYYADVAAWQFDNPVLAKIQDQIYASWTGFAATKDVTMKLAAASCATGSDGQKICAPTESTQTIGLLYDPQDAGAINPCTNTDVPDFPGVLPMIEQQPDGSFEAVCAPNTDRGFAGPELRVALSDSDLVALHDQADQAVVSMPVARQCRALILDYDPTSEDVWAEAPQSCYTGSVGAQVFSTRTLVTDIAIARDELKQSSDAYRIAMQSCFIQQAGNAQMRQAQQSFEIEMNRLGDGKLAADVVSTWANTTGDCLATLAGAEKPWSFGLAGGACGAYAVGAIADTASLSLQNDMDRAERAHESTMMALEQSTDEARCFKEAELELVGVRAAYLDIKRAQQELSSAYLQTQQTLDILKAEYEAARGDVEAAEASAVLVPAQSPWYNQDLAEYERKFRLARRAAYLAVRAVEYEFQMSSSYRTDVLEAHTPVELEQVLTELRQTSNSNSVGGARPAELTQIVSLKDHLLQLGDRSQNQPDGWQRLTPTERFRKMLVDPDYEVYQDGVFVGRNIPFDIAPLSVLDRGSYQGIPIVSDNSCAERLWSLNVTVQGKDGEVFGGLNPSIDLEVRKRNTFYSNYCDSAEADFQVASVRPSRNLFREPGVGEGISGVTGQTEADGFSKARIQARLNVAPQDFSSDAYTDGASTELAARGLFGEYSLFIPATSLAPVSNGQPDGDGLVLNKVDDILLRVDYVSVAR